MNTDDPKLTAYALGELPPDEAAAIEQELAAAPEARAYVAEVRSLTASLAAEFRTDLQDRARADRNILPMPYGRLFWSERRWPSLAIAALLVGALLITGILMWHTESAPTASNRTRRSASATEPSDAAVIVDYSGTSDDGAAVEASRRTESPFIAAADRATSTFSAHVGTSSYPAIRAAIEAGVRPAKSAVRIEEMINFFSYDYPAPAGEQAARLMIDAASCPWADGHQLVRVGVRFQDPATDRAIDQLMRRCIVEVQFNPQRVEAYRLIGYDADTSGDAAPDHSGSADVPPRHTVIGLYEIIPAANAQPASGGAGGNVLTAALKFGGDASAVVAEQSFDASAVPFADASDDFRFAAAVAEFGMILRDSAYKGNADVAAVLQWAEGAKAADAQRERTAFVACMRKAQSVL